MKFLFDHDVPDEMAFSLAALGHEVVYLREILPANSTDEEVLRTAGARAFVLITRRRGCPTRGSSF